MLARKWPLTYLIIMALIASAGGLLARYGTGETCEMDGTAREGE